MIELFTRRLDTLILPLDAEFTRISIDESIVSLSAILLNDVYYDLLKNGKKVLDGFSVIDFEALILFKLKAYLDLKERKKEKRIINRLTQKIFVNIKMIFLDCCSMLVQCRHSRLLMKSR